MSSVTQNRPLEGGQEPQWIVGRIYAEWCGHCINMKSAWNKLRDNNEEKGGKEEKVKFIEIEDVNLELELPELNKKYFHGKEGVKSSGFPTIFIFHAEEPHKTLKYYSGERDVKSMSHWIEENIRSTNSTNSNNKTVRGGRPKKGKEERKEERKTAREKESMPLDREKAGEREKEITEGAR